MEATPNEYRADIERTMDAIALIDLGELMGDTRVQASKRRALLVRQLEELDRSLARAERLWAEAQARGAGVRLG